MPVHLDNTTAVGIVNNTFKRQRSRAMEMRYFWLLCQEAQQILKVVHKPAAENMADYLTKAHFGQIHKHVRPYYLHMPNLPNVLYRAVMPSTQQGCAEILGNRYQGRILYPEFLQTKVLT